jgi:hypothetical protein
MYSTHGDFDKTGENRGQAPSCADRLIGFALGFYFGTKNSQSYSRFGFMSNAQSYSLAMNRWNISSG